MSIAQEKQEHIRIGVDLGGTKIEFVALERHGRELHRHRIATPRFDYKGTVLAVAHAAEGIEKELGRSATVGIGIPGTISTKTGLVKNANSTWLNGKPFDKDLSRALGREVRCANDANCLAVSEATDGAGEAAALAAVDRFEDRLVRGLAQVINLLDPDVIVMGGGASQIPRLYHNVPARLKEYVFGKEADTPILAAKHGDASGVRGAAWQDRKSTRLNSSHTVIS